MNGRWYDLALAGAEHAGLGRMRRRAWASVPASGLGLEVGAGSGANFAFHPPGSRVVATDLSCPMLCYARRKPEARDTLLVVCDAQHLPFRDRAFDWAAETLAFCEVPDRDAALQEIGRVIGPGAPLVMLEHVRPGGVLGRVADLVSRVTVPLWGEHFDRSPELPLARTGFRVEKREWLLRDWVLLLVARKLPDGGGRRAGKAAPARR